MKRIIEAIQKDLEINNYYSALYVGLSLIDTCSKIEFPKITSNGKRYINWLNTFFVPLYELYIAEQIFPANAIYQLRCSVLHESTNYIDQQNRIKYQDIKNLYRVVITETPSHRNKASISNGKETIDEIQINILRFIQEIIYSIEKWMEQKRPEDYSLKFSINLENWSSAILDGKQAFKQCK
jgi:hypothetical protein